MSISGFIQTEYFVNEEQHPLISGQALYRNSYFDNFDEVDYSFIQNNVSDNIYLYVVNELYESVILFPREIIDLLHLELSGDTMSFTTTVDWLFGGSWHSSSELKVTLSRKKIDNQSYIIFGSDTVCCDRDENCLFQLYDLYFDGVETGRIFSRFLVRV